MNNFEFRNPVKLIVGKGSIVKLSANVPKGSKVMMIYGGGSIKHNGVYDQVKTALAAYDMIEFSGIEANPDYATAMKAIALCKSENIDFIVAVGGGSVIDATKFIASGANFDGDPWDCIQGKATFPPTIPFGTVLTLPATGSEMNEGAVISRRETNEKYAFSNPKGFPVFSILDPDTLSTLPLRQVANGIIDTYIHTVEQYMTTPGSLKVMDYFAEGILKTLIEIAPALIKEERDYANHADFMLAATMGLNGFIAMGVDQDWSTHMIGHELTALHGLDHAVTLAIVYPGTMDVMRKEKEAKLLQYAAHVWGITEGTTAQRIDEAIQKTEAFFQSLSVKTRLGDYGIGEETIQTIVSRFTERGWQLGENKSVSPAVAEKILRNRL